MSSILALLAAAGAAQAYTNLDSGFFMRKNIDPIVVPGQYTSHMHSFFGGDAVTINTTTTKELQSGCHTNSNPNDFSVYWHPTLYAVKGQERIPIEARYFKPYYINIHEAEIPYPEDFKVVSGNAKAAAQADIDPLSGVEWFCEYGPAAEKDAAAFPTEGCSLGRLQALLLFHDCVDTDTLETAYSGRHNLPNPNRCPTGMKRVPQLRFSVRFDTSAALPEGWSGTPPLELASGPSYSWHGDFINGWLEEAAQNMLLATDKRVWQYVDGPLKEAPACQAEDADPENGTDDYEESLKFLGKSNPQPSEAAEIPSAVSTSFSSSAPTATSTSTFEIVNNASTLTTTTIPQATGGSTSVTPDVPVATQCGRKKRSLRHRRRRVSA